MQKINKKEDVEEVIKVLVSKRDKEVIQRVKLFNYVLKTISKVDTAFLKLLWGSSEYQELFKFCCLQEDSDL